MVVSHLVPEIHRRRSAVAAPERVPLVAEWSGGRLWIKCHTEEILSPSKALSYHCM
jgi:hypothetical protein